MEGSHAKAGIAGGPAEVAQDPAHTMLSTGSAKAVDDYNIINAQYFASAPTARNMLGARHFAVIVPDGLSWFGVELTMPGQFRSVRGFASVVEVYAGVVEHDKAEARRIASVARPFNLGRRPTYYNVRSATDAQSVDLTGGSVPCVGLGCIRQMTGGPS